MKLLSVILGAVFAAKNEECPANSEGAAERCESACQDSYIGTILRKPNRFSQVINYITGSSVQGCAHIQMLDLTYR